MPYKIKEEAAAALTDLVSRAMTKVAEPIEGSQRLIADIYTGRDPSGGGSLDFGDQGTPYDEALDALKPTSTWTPPKTTANLFMSRLRQIVTALTPGVPSFRVEARTPGAIPAAEYQNELIQFVTDHGDLNEAMRRAAFLGMVSPYFGVKLVVNGDAQVAYDACSFLAIESSACGYEPFHRRFTWHTYQKQWGDLPLDYRPKVDGGAKPDEWEICEVTEVYHEGFRFGRKDMGEHPMSVFVKRLGDLETDLTETSEVTVGDYVYTEDLPDCPLVIGNYLDPAPGEDLPPCEVVSWIPLMRMIVQTLVQINREVTTVNNIILYDKSAISPETISIIQNAVPGARIYAGVDADNADRGVNATMRPIEQNSILNEYLASLQTYMALFDDITGVGPIDRGVSANPRKSATEASSIVNSSSRRNRDRLEILARCWGDIARVHHSYQRVLYGTAIEVPLPGKGLSRIIPIPDPEVMHFAFTVDPVELGHLSRKDDLDTNFNWLTTMTNIYGTFQGAMPRMVRESLRRTGKALGIVDVDHYLDTPVIEEGPQDRYMRHLQTGEPIIVSGDDQHDMYIAYYSKLLDQALAQGIPGANVDELKRTIDRHNEFVQANAAAMPSGNPMNLAPVPGVGPQGEIDNNALAAMLAGGPPPAV